MSETKYVLVVDDDVDLVESISISLESEGFKVGKALDGEKAMESIRYKRPDLVILDVVMPGMDGYEVYEKLKNDETYRDIPIIMLTAIAPKVAKMAYIHSTGIRLATDDYIQKPINLDILNQRVVELIS